MTVKQMVAQALCKATEGTDDDGKATGQVEAIVSVFGNVDSMGDRVLPGAFDGFVEGVKDGQVPPYVWSHQTHSPEMFIGDVVDAEQLAAGDDRLPAELKDLGGLWVQAQYHLDEPMAAKAFKLAKTGQVAQYSFAYSVDEAQVADDDDRVQELVKLTVHEVGPTMYGANDATTTLAAKDRKAGRVLSRKNEQALRDAHQAIGSGADQLASDDGDADDEGKAHQAPTEGAAAGKGQEPATATPEAGDSSKGQGTQDRAADLLDIAAVQAAAANLI